MTRNEVQLVATNEDLRAQLSSARSRIKQVERHRDQWRRIAWRLEEELRKHDEAAARAIFESADSLQTGGGSDAV